MPKNVGGLLWSSKILCGLSVLFLSLPGYGVSLDVFPIDQTPRASDWRYFHDLPLAKQHEVWDGHARQGKTFKDWAWEWRLAWVRVCASTEERWCRDMLQTALFDKALVVRSEAALRIGQRYEGTANEDVTRLLIKAYQDPRNSRKGRPLFIQERILFALKSVGGSTAMDQAKRLAGGHQTTQKYWGKIEKM